MGVREQIIFPEIDYDKIDEIKGMNISFVTTARNDEEGRALLAPPRHAVPAANAMAKAVDAQPVNRSSRRRSSSVRHRNRCKVCGRSRAFLRKFEMCRICFRLLALRGEIPGVIKSSW